MPPLDHDGRDLLLLMQRSDGDVVSADVPDVLGETESGSLALTLDAARRVVAVDVRRVEELRRPDALDRAAREAFQVGEARRVVASLEKTGELARYEALGEERISGRRPLQVPPRPAVFRGGQRRGGTGVLDAGSAARPVAGTSDNTYLSVRLGADGRLLGVEADELWLSAASPEHLGRALAGAFRDASRRLVDLVTGA